jgi:hypothetical protein
MNDFDNIIDHTITRHSEYEWIYSLQTICYEQMSLQTTNVTAMQNEILKKPIDI